MPFDFVQQCCVCDEAYDTSDMMEYCSNCGSLACYGCFPLDKFMDLKYENYLQKFKLAKKDKKMWNLKGYYVGDFNGISDDYDISDDSDNECIVKSEPINEPLKFEEWEEMIEDGHDIKYTNRYNMKGLVCYYCKKSLEHKKALETIKKLKVMLLANNLNMEILQNIYKHL